MPTKTPRSSYDDITVMLFNLLKDSMRSYLVEASFKCDLSIPYRTTFKDTVCSLIGKLCEPDRPLTALMLHKLNELIERALLEFAKRVDITNPTVLLWGIDDALLNEATIKLSACIEAALVFGAEKVFGYSPFKKSKGELSDGYHTFNELYAYRLAYSAMLFNTWARQGIYEVHKSKRHYEGELCFGGDYFIVAARLPTGVISNHYKLRDEYWDAFKIEEVQRSLFKYDGYTPADALVRMNLFIKHM